MLSASALRSRYLLRELLEALPAAIYTTDAEGRITFYNSAAAELWGVRPEIDKDEWCGSWRLYWPDGRPMPHSTCPMAVALKEKRPIRGAEAIAERPDGTRIPFLAYPTPLFNDEGVLVGAINMLVDVTERKRAQDLWGRLAALVESSDDAIASKDLTGTVMTWNPGAERLFGYSADEMIGKSIMLIIPPDRQHEEAEILDRIRRGEHIAHFETVRRRKDGRLIEISLTVSPVKDSAGRVIGASKIARDIGAYKRAQEQQALTLREMNHRVKNLFAVANSLVTLSARSASSPQEMASTVGARLEALAKAHSLARSSFSGPSDQPGASLSEVIRTVLAPYGESGESQAGRERISVSGPEVSLGQDTVTSVALALHELASNAAKYGALSSPGGHLRIEWSVAEGNVTLLWEETGGPPLEETPQHEGFGTFLLRRTVKSQLGGDLSHEWMPGGLRMKFRLPLETLAR